MTVTPTQDGTHTTLAIEGRVDTNTSPQLQAEILRIFQSAKLLTLDFEKVPYISSAGLRALLIGQKTAAAKGAAMELVHIQDQVMSVLEMSGFDGILTIR
ncbi:MAG: STAS domain-containing protein [Oscillospiraceae bacterium]|nr:STAS domain-containing protein [Oscillospiraceae bacterium]